MLIKFLIVRHAHLLIFKLFINLVNMRYETFHDVMTQGHENKVPIDETSYKRFARSLHEIYEEVNPRTRKQAEKYRTAFWSGFGSGEEEGVIRGKQTALAVLDSAERQIRNASAALIQDVSRCR